ncbi:hypothetical protein KI387_016910, partial [Taxus chinensis]
LVPKYRENQLSPSPGNTWDSCDVEARIGRKSTRWSTQHPRQLGHQDAWGTKSRTGRKNEENYLSLVSHGMGHLGQKYARDADQPVWRKSVHFRRFGDICPRQSGTVGKKVRGGRELAGSAETEDFHFGHRGQKYARDAKRQKSREQMESYHVSSLQTGTRKPESSGSEIFVPGSLGHPGQ